MDLNEFERDSRLQNLEDEQQQVPCSCLVFTYRNNTHQKRFLFNFELKETHDETQS